MKFLLYALFGCIIGVANIIPGVSGGTMAVILNVYDKLLDAFTGIRKHFKESMKFLVPVAIGAAAGIFAFAKLLKYLLAVFPMPTFFFFIGLIVGGIPFVGKKALETKFKPVSLLTFFIFFAGMIALSFVQPSGNTAAQSQMQLDLWSCIYLFFGSSVAAMCMIIPGVSGSMILMIFGLYSYILKAIADLFSDMYGSVMILIPAGLGIVLGIVGGAKLMDVCIKKFPQPTFFAIIGLMTGSLLSIYNNSGFTPDVNGVVAIIALIFGAAVSFIFSSDKIKKALTKGKNSTDTSDPETSGEQTAEKISVE